MDQLLENHLFATHAIAASASVTLGTALTYPLDTIKTLIQVGSGSSKQLTASQVIARVRRLSGNSGIYSGAGWSNFGRISGLGGRFGVYEIATGYFKDGREDNYVYVSEALMAGMAAGTVESLITSPFEMLKLRAQVASASISRPATASLTENQTIISKFLRGCVPDVKALNNSISLLSTLNTKHPNMVGALKEYPWMMTGSGKPPSVCDVRRPVDIISLEGWGSLWRGFRSGLIRDATFAGVFFSTWQFLHQVMLNWKAVGMDPEPRSDAEVGPLSPWGVSLAAGFSGAVAAAASHSFDTAKNRSLCTVLPKYTIMERKLMKYKTPGKRFEKLAGIHPADRKVLFRAISIRMARSGVASFAIVGGYFLAVDLLVSK